MTPEQRLQALLTVCQFFSQLAAAQGGLTWSDTTAFRKTLKVLFPNGIDGGTTDHTFSEDSIGTV